ncbi:MAG: recombination protein O N-terminal domain-containing protein [Candidatus Dojkabacteria bacterium]|nr:recombination protein O N-terminal domain-containing protein [Candidatus Dojkabacteria bacterium]
MTKILDKKSKIIILNKFKYSDNTSILEALCDDGSLRRFLVKNKNSSNFYALGNILEIVYREGRNFSYITETQIIRSILTIQTYSEKYLLFVFDVIKITYMLSKQYKDKDVFNLIYKLLRESQEEDKLIGLYTNFLRKLLDLLNEDRSIRCHISGEKIRKNSTIFFNSKRNIIIKDSKHISPEFEKVIVDQEFIKNYYKNILCQVIGISKESLKF